VANRGLRLPIPSSWSAPTKSLLESMWADDPTVRPPFSSIVAQLEAIQAAASAQGPTRRKSMLPILRPSSARTAVQV
jgi:hypothetical protein